MAKRSIEEMVADRYSHPDVRTAVLKSIEENGTAKDILSGKLALPSEHDAMRHASGVDHHEEMFRKQSVGIITPNAYDAMGHRNAILRHNQMIQES
jgi:hypothetical protein